MEYRPDFQRVSVEITRDELNVLENLLQSASNEFERTGLWGYYVPGRGWGGERLKEFIARVDVAIVAQKETR